METGLKLFMCLASLACTVSCIQEENAPESVKEEKTITFTAYADEDIESTEVKSILHTDGVSVHWSNEDKIQVFSGAGNGVVSNTANVSYDKKKADFTVKTTLADTYYAIYPPYEDAQYSSEYNYVSAYLPTAQPAIGGSFGDEVNLAMARSEGTRLYFRNAGAILAVKNPTNYASSIKIVSRDESVKMTGKAALSFNNGEPKVVSSGDAVNYVELNSGVSGTVGQIFNCIVYPGNYASGFDIIFASSSSPHLRAIYSSSKALDLKRNDNYMLFNFTGNFSWNSIAGPTSVSVAYKGWQAMTVNWAWNYTIPSDQTDPRAGYKVYARKSGSTNILKEITVAGNTTYTQDITGLDVDTYYDFGVQVLKTGGKASEIVWAKNVWVAGNKCTPPTPLTIEQISETKVNVTWKDNTGTEGGYVFWKVQVNGDNEKTDTAPLSVDATFYETTVEAGKTYKFGIQAQHKDDSAFDSEIVWFDPFTALSWEDLQKVDMGYNDCLEPVVTISHNYYSENGVIGAKATINWTCGSGAAKGFRVYFRESSDPEWTLAHFNSSSAYVEHKGADSWTYTFGKVFEYGKTYVIGVQAIHNSSASRNSDIVNVSLMLTQPQTTKYDWELDRTAVPTWSDMTLCYGGNPERNPYLWDKERFASHAIYTDQNGQMHYLFDAFLALEFEMNGYILEYSGEGKYSARRTEWTKLINYWFDDTYGFQALDDCLSDAAKVIGAPRTKRLVIFVLPDPVYCKQFTDKSSSTTYWGKYDDGETADFSTEDGRVKAYKWMIDQVRARFAEKNYKHIELGGFYILSETLSTTYNSSYKEYTDVIPKVAKYCHNYYEGLYWIPYSYSLNDTGTYGHNATLKKWADYGFDYVTYQPNAYWREGKFKGKTWTKTYDYLGMSGVGMEFEFEGTHGEDHSPSTSILTNKTDGSANSMAATNKDRFKEYMTICRNKNYYGSKRLVLYTGTNGWHELATSTDPLDQELYHETASFFLNNPLKKSNSVTSTPNFNYGGSLN